MQVYWQRLDKHTTEWVWGNSSLRYISLPSSNSPPLSHLFFFPISLCGVLVFDSVSRRLLLRPFFATSIFHTPSLSTTIFHTPSFTHHLYILVNHHLSSTFVFQPPSVTHHLSHTVFETSTFVLRRRRGTYGTGLALVARLKTPLSGTWNACALCLDIL